MTAICAWDWQAIAGFAGAGSVLWAAYLAKSTIVQFREQRLAERQLQVAEEALTLSAHLATTIIRLRRNPALHVLYEFVFKNPNKDVLKGYEAAAFSTMTALPAVEQQADTLQRLSFHCDVLHDKETGDACRAIASDATKFAAAHKAIPPAIKMLALEPAQASEFVSRIKPYFDVAFAPTGTPDEFSAGLEGNLERVQRRLRTYVRAERADRAGGAAR